jgi:DHA1 family bicyclomycin/chloramphenicol resistance-like MFS transporter
MTQTTPSRFLDRSTPPHLLTLVLLASVSAMNMSIFLPSLPAMTQEFGTSYSIMQLSVTAYLACTAVIQIIIGPISDRFGRRPVILASMVVFVAASIGCAMATSIEVFLAFRMIQSAVAVAMVLSRAIVRDMVGQEEAASMIGYVTMGMAIVPMIGPAIGGALDQTLGWQANFWLLLVLGALVLGLVYRDLGETAQTTSASFAAQFREYPELLTSRRFWGYCACAAFAAGAFFSYLGGAPFVGSEVFGMSAAQVGLFFGAPALGYFFGNGISGRYSTKLGINRMILYGALLTVLGMGSALLLFLAGFQNAYVFFGFTTFVGLGNGMVLPNATSGMLSVRPHLAGTASGLGGAIMLGGGATLSALAGVILTGGDSAYPLLMMMLATSILGVIAILYTIRRQAQVTGP